MEYPRIALKVGPRAFSKLVDLGNKVFSSLSGSGFYLTPSPSLVLLQSQITDVINARDKWGSRSNHGSKEDYIDLCYKALTLQLTLKQIGQYVSNTAERAAGSDYSMLQALLSTSGFDLAQTKAEHTLLQAVRDLRILSSRSLAWNQVKLRWTRPLNTSRSSDVSYYQILKSMTPDFTAAVPYGTSTKGEFIDTNSTSSSVTWYYWVVAYNPAGAGAPSDMLAVKLLAA